MKRILAFLLCWTMLLSQLVMLAEAAKMQEQADILYLEENGIHVEGDGEVFMDNAPLGRSDDTERYAPSIPKFVPETLKNLEPVHEEGLPSSLEEEEDPMVLTSPCDIKYKAAFNKDKVLVYAYAGDDAECEYFKGAMGVELEVYSTVSPLWYALDQPVTPESEYGYVRVEDIDFIETRQPKKVAYYTDPETGITVHLPDMPATRELRVSPVAAERAPMRNVPGRNMGERTLLASYKVGVFSRDGARWSGEQETQVSFTLPEVPELGKIGCYYAECVDAQGNVEELTVYPYLWSNVLFVMAPMDREIFVYSVDYPENESILHFTSDEEVYLSEKFDRFNTGRDFSEVVDVSISNPESVELTPIYNEAGKVVDWKLLALEPFYGRETIQFTYRKSGGSTRVDVGSGSSYTWAPGGNLNGHYNIIANLVSVQNNVAVQDGGHTATIRVGAANKTDKVTKLRLAERILVGAGETLNLTIDTGCGGSSIYRWANSDHWDTADPMIYVNGGTLKTYGAHTNYAPNTSHRLKLWGNNQSWSRALIHVNEGGLASFFSTEIYDADNTRADSSFENVKNGGAIYVAGGTSVVELRDETLIHDCNASRGGAIYINGGTVKGRKTGERTSATVTIYSNTANEGAGVYLYSGSLTKADYVSLTIRNNTGSCTKGGGMYIFSGTVTTSGNYQLNIHGNTATYGGGVYIGGVHDTNTSKHDVTLNGDGTGWDIYENTANTNGGGIMAENCKLWFWANADIVNNTAKDNGGGIMLNSWTSSADTYVYRDVDIYGNQATNKGGGLYVGGSIFSPQGGASVVIGSAIVDNRSDSTPYNRAAIGAGMYITGGHVEAAGGGITVSDNQASNRGGGVFMYSGTIKWTKKDADNIGSWSIHGNSASVKGGGLYINSGTVTCESEWQMNVYGNKAPYGGGAYIGGKGEDDKNESSKSIVFNGSGSGGWDVYSNEATGYNGGGFMVEVCTLTVDSPVWLSHNKANGTTAEGRGGNMYIGGWGVGGTCIVKKNFTVYGGTAKQYGGGIFISDNISKLDIQSGTFTVSKGQTNGLGDKENSAPNGGAICIFNGTLVNNSTLNIYNSKATGGSGGAIYMGGGTFTSTGTMNVNGNTATSNGGAVYLAANSNYSSTGLLSMTGNSADGAGGGFYATAASKFEVTGPSDYNNSIGNNTANGQGGGIWTINTSVKLQNTNVYGNKSKSAHAGGMIFLRDEADAGTFNIELSNCGITNNSCLNESPITSDDDRGAGIYAERVNLTVDNCTIQGNSTPYGRGGGIFFRSSDGRQETLTIRNNSVITGNSAKGSSTNGDRGLGGGVYVDKQSIVQISDSTISGNEAECYGGGICMGGTSTLNCSGTTNVNSNSAATGGGIYLSGATVNNSGTLNVEGNTASGTDSGSGGGIYQNSGTFDNTGTLNVKNNTATDTGTGTTGGKGGGVHLNSGTFKAGTMNVIGNTASIDGGGLYLKAGTFEGGTVTVNGNHATKYAGGGIYSLTALTFTGAFTLGASDAHNTAPRHGGGIYIKNGKLECQSTMSMGYNDGGMGGGIYLDSGATLETKGIANINNNTATYNSSVSTSGNGAGMYVNGGTITNTSTLNVYSNVADLNGGGMYLNTLNTSTSFGTANVYDNTATSDNGGGIYSAVALTLSSGVTVGHETDATKGNRAGNHGGGIYCAVDVTLTDAKVYHNSAGGNGGGICVYDGRNVTLAGTCRVDGNSAAFYGGGVYINTGTITTENATAMSFTGNRAGHSGGGILISEATAKLTNATFTDNLAGHNGGAIYSFGTKLELNSANPFSGNMAGTVLNADGTPVTSELGGNGGAIYFDGQNKTSLSLTGTELKNNMARRVKDNENGHGGAIYAINCGVTLTGDVRIHGNTAECNGGGISLYDATLNSTASGGKTPHIYSNTAGNGGGILVGGASVLTQDWSALALTVGGGTAEDPLGNTANLGGGLFFDGINMTVGPNVNIHYNKATADGGGVYIKVLENRSPTLTVKTGTEISYNTADRDGGGILADVSHVTLEAGVEIHHNAAGRNGGGINVQRERKIDPERAFPVVTLGGTGAQTLIQNNNAAKQGGGIYIICGHLYATNTDVSHNVSGTMGGGILMASYTDAGLDLAEMVLQFENGNLSDNTSGQNAGGAYAEGYGKLTIHNTTIARNKTAGDGGGLLLSMKGNSPTMTDCTIDSNVAGLLEKDGKNYGNGGGIRMYTMNSAPVLTNTSITNNVAYLNGGGISIESAPLKLDSTNTVSGNYAGAVVPETRAVTATASENGGNGGGIYFTGSGRTLTLQGATINNNHALSSGETNGNGGGVYMNAGTKLAVIGTQADQLTVAGSESSFVIHNTAANYGGGIYMVGGTAEKPSVIDVATGYPTEVNGEAYKVNLLVGNDNATTGNTAKSGGGIYLDGGVVNLTGDHELFVRHNKATDDSGTTVNSGGGMLLAGATLNVRDGVGVLVGYNTADNDGAGIAIQASAKLNDATTERFNIYLNTAKGNGGGIWSAGDMITNGMYIGVANENGTISNSAKNGGGLYMDGGTFTADGTTYIINNQASANGGGIYTTTDLTLDSNVLVGYLQTKDDGTEVKWGNYAKYGGGIYIDGATVTLDGATVQYNRATEDGGGVYVKVGTANLTGATIDSNYAGISKSIDISQIEAEGFDYSTIDGGYGGGVYVAEGAAMTMNGGAISNNGAYAEAAERGDGYGGGLFVATDATATLQSGTISKNYAYGKDNYSLTAMGGGVYTQGTVEFTGDFTISENKSSRYGGGFYQTNGNSKTTISEGVTVDITGNKATWGGGMAFGSGEVAGTGEFVAEGILNVVSNEATSYTNSEGKETGGNGGGIYMAGGTVTLKSQSKIESNTATSHGGGVYMNKGTLTLDGESHICGNTAGSRGGGISMNGDDTVSVTVKGGSSVSENEATASNGGGVWMANGTLTIEGDSSVFGNTSGEYGGGIYTKGGTVKITDSTVERNETVYDGAGIFLNNQSEGETAADVSVVLDHADVIWNEAGRNGGGIYIARKEGATVTATESVFASNSATGDGGALYIAADTTAIVTLTDTEIKENTATSYFNSVGKRLGGNGGGIRMNSGTVTLTGTKTDIHGNCARFGGGIYVIDGTLSITGGVTIRDHQWENMTETEKLDTGGGLWMNGGTVTLEQVALKNNRASSDGGGIRLKSGKLSLTDVTIQGNSSEARGGGIFMANAEATATTVLELHLSRVTVDGNTANSNGGGIYVEHGTVTETDSTVSNNVSGKNGGGFYVQNVELTLSGATFDNNHAGTSKKTDGTPETSSYGGSGGGIFFANTKGGLNTLTLNGVELKNNRALSISAVNDGQTEHTGGRGGGVAVENSNLLIQSATGIHDNYAQRNGGGVSILRKNNDGTTVYAVPRMTVEGTAEQYIRIQNNTAGHQGGGLYVYGSHFDASYMIVNGNTSANHGGGMLLVSYESDPETKLPNLNLSEMECRVKHCEITSNISGAHAGGAWIEGYQHEDVQISDTTMTGNQAHGNGGALYLRYTKMTLSGTDSITNNHAYAVGDNSGMGGGIMIHNGSSLTVARETKKAFIRDNTAETAGNDIFAVGATSDGLQTVLTMPATQGPSRLDETKIVDEYWFADYAQTDAKYPGKDTFPSNYRDPKTALAHLGRYDSEVTPISFARRSFGGSSTELGAEEASKAYLALTLGEARYMNLTLTKELANGETAVENTTFIFYLRGVDNEKFLLPVAIHLAEGATDGTVTLTDIPLGYYDICEDESWSWRYDPSTAAYTEQGKGVFHRVNNGDDYLRVQATISESTSHAVTFTNGIENVRWLSDALYMPFLTPAKVNADPAEDEEETE